MLILDIPAIAIYMFHINEPSCILIVKKKSTAESIVKAGISKTRKAVGCRAECNLPI